MAFHASCGAKEGLPEGLPSGRPSQLRLPQTPSAFLISDDTGFSAAYSAL